LSDIPLLGRLFRFDSLIARRTELLIIMTPRVVRTPADAEAIRRQEAARMHWCCADVHEIHGVASLCNDLNCPGCNASIPVLYPDFNPRGSLPDATSEELESPDLPVLPAPDAPEGPDGPQLPPPPPPPLPLQEVSKPNAFQRFTQQMSPNSNSQKPGQPAGVSTVRQANEPLSSQPVPQLRRPESGVVNADGGGEPVAGPPRVSRWEIKTSVGAPDSQFGRGRQDQQSPNFAVPRQLDATPNRDPLEGDWWEK
jgi:hypothetical protein